jgi:hypothetical protein
MIVNNLQLLCIVETLSCSATVLSKQLLIFLM